MEQKYIKAMMWLIHMQQTDGVEIKHARNGASKAARNTPLNCGRLLPGDKNDVRVHGCFGHGHLCQPFRDVINANGDTLPARYEQTKSRLKQITRAGYQVNVQWECKFDDSGIDTPNCSNTRHCARVLCVPGTLSTWAGPRPCAYTIRRGKVRLYNTWMP